MTQRCDFLPSKALVETLKEPMDCVIPPTSPFTMLLFLSQSIMVVFPWSTCPMTVITGGRLGRDLSTSTSAISVRVRSSSLGLNSTTLHPSSDARISASSLDSFDVGDRSSSPRYFIASKISSVGAERFAAKSWMLIVFSNIRIFPPCKLLRRLLKSPASVLIGGGLLKALTLSAGRLLIPFLLSRSSLNSWFRVAHFRLAFKFNHSSSVLAFPFPSLGRHADLPINLLPQRSTRWATLVKMLQSMGLFRPPSIGSCVRMFK
mmetsp:Transcript_44919/g.174335  ORF Transcript_44919/g.174335 Transcript_44919/m.174335 type:complete len:262 (+) Transcript_44919:1887-2672(+)